MNYFPATTIIQLLATIEYKVTLTATEECWVGKVSKGTDCSKNISFSPKGRTVPTAALLDTKHKDVLTFG